MSGRRRFGYQQQTGPSQDYLEFLKDDVFCNVYNEYPLRDMLQNLVAMRTDLQAAKTELDCPPAPARDALTGLVLSQLPSGVEPGPPPTDPGAAPDTAAVVEDKLRQVNQILAKLKDTYTDEYDGLVHKFI